MKEHKNAIIYIIATIVIVLILVLYKPTSASSTTSSVETVRQTSVTPIDATQRKQEILKQIDEINKTIANTNDQVVIDQLAKEKDDLMREYMQLDNK